MSGVGRTPFKRVEMSSFPGESAKSTRVAAQRKAYPNHSDFPPESPQLSSAWGIMSRKTLRKRLRRAFQLFVMASSGHA
jgi:hypothetical protein